MITIICQGDRQRLPGAGERLGRSLGVRVRAGRGAYLHIYLDKINGSSALSFVTELGRFPQSFAPDARGHLACDITSIAAD